MNLRYKQVKEIVGILVVVSTWIDVYVGVKFGQGDYLIAFIGVGVASLIGYLYYKLYIYLLEQINKKG